MENSKSGGVQTVKSAGVSLLLTLVLVLLFSVVLKFCPLPSGWIKAVNQVIKGVSVFLGCFLFLPPEKAYLKGIFAGLLYAVCAGLFFSALSSFSLHFFLDLLFLGLVGFLSGLAVGALKR